MAAKFATQFLRNQWRVLNADKVLSEDEVHALVKSVEAYLKQPGSEPVRAVVSDYDAFTKYVASGVAKGIFPSLWVQYLQSGKVGFLRFQSYRDTLPQGTPTTPTAPPTTMAKPAPRPAFPRCCQDEFARIRKLLRLSALIDVIAITDDVHAFSSGAAKGALTGKLRDPDLVASGMGLADSSFGALLPLAAKSAELHAALHADSDDRYYEAWWSKLAKAFRRFAK